MKNDRQTSFIDSFHNVIGTLRLLPTEIKVFKIDTCMDEAPSFSPRDCVLKSKCHHNSHDSSTLKAQPLFEKTLVPTVHTLMYLVNPCLTWVICTIPEVPGSSLGLSPSLLEV